MQEYRAKRGNIYPKMLAFSWNLSLWALYNIKLGVYGSNSSWYVDEEQTKDLKMIIENLNIHVKSIKELLSVEREKVYTKQVYNNGDF